MLNYLKSICRWLTAPFSDVYFVSTLKTRKSNRVLVFLSFVNWTKTAHFRKKGGGGGGVWDFIAVFRTATCFCSAFSDIIFFIDSAGGRNLSEERGVYVCDLTRGDGRSRGWLDNNKDML